MAFFAGLSRYCPIRRATLQSNYSYSSCYRILHQSCGFQWFSTEPNRSDFPVENAYDILRISETSSFAEIKASFHKLAKQTHPDLSAESANSFSSSNRFVQILAAYEILSNSEKRAHYDVYLMSQRKFVEMQSRKTSTLHMYNSRIVTNKQMEVVEWLRWYREAINDILLENKIVVGTGYLDELEANFYSAIRDAYFGPDIESLNLLPDRFEAEERSVCETREVLHLVSGRDLFGMVRLVEDIPKLNSAFDQKLTSFFSVDLGDCAAVEKAKGRMSSKEAYNVRVSPKEDLGNISHTLDVYRDLELHISGRVVALATREPPKNSCDGKVNEDDHDHIHVFLNLDKNPNFVGQSCSNDSPSGGVNATKFPLGTISGLGTSPDEGSCFVYDSNGANTHMIMKHRTLLVKHMHWFRIGEKVSICECRCTRARLPPSKFWLFEPRSDMHDIGGWYIETFGRNKKRLNVLSQRFWDGFDASDIPDDVFMLQPALGRVGKHKGEIGEVGFYNTSGKSYSLELHNNAARDLLIGLFWAVKASMK